MVFPSQTNVGVTDGSAGMTDPQTQPGTQQQQQQEVEQEKEQMRQLILVRDDLGWFAWVHASIHVFLGSQSGSGLQRQAQGLVALACNGPPCCPLHVHFTGMCALQTRRVSVAGHHAMLDGGHACSSGMHRSMLQHSPMHWLTWWISRAGPSGCGTCIAYKPLCCIAAMCDMLMLWPACDSPVC